MKKHVLLVGVLVGWCALPGVVAAQGGTQDGGFGMEGDAPAGSPPGRAYGEEGGGPPPGAHRRGQVGAELGIFLDDVEGGSVTVLTPELYGWYAITPQIGISADWGFSYASISPEVGDGESGFHVGNPFLAGWYVMAQRDLYLRVGAGVGLPLASLPDDPLTDPSFLVAAFAYGYALSMEGQWDAWLWIPENLSFAIPAEVRKRFDGGLFVGGEGALALFIPTGDEGDTELGIQLAGEVGYDAGLASFGARLQGVWVPTGDGDNFQLSTVPFVELDFGGGFANARLVLNIDDPAGFSFDSDGVWGLHVGGGVNL